MKTPLPNSYHLHYDDSEKNYDRNRKNNLTWLLKVAIMAFMLFLSVTYLRAQAVSGGWTLYQYTGNPTGYQDYGNGVVRLISKVNTGCAGAAVSKSTAYSPTSGSDFSQCYQAFFGCPGNDNIGNGTDQNGDGMAFSFFKCTYPSYTLPTNSCGGGLGYMNACSDNKMITIEFDTYSSMGASNFDAHYGGGTSGNHDEIALQRDGDASDNGWITAVDAGNLEDGLEHTVCITYTASTHHLSVKIDGNLLFDYNMTGSPYDLPTYFGAGALNIAWSSGKAGATNPATINAGDGTTITSQLGGVPLCPAGVQITSPSDGASFTGCPIPPITINATATPPAGNTTTSVDFLVDGVVVGTDNTANYSYTWTPSSTGSHVLTTVAHWSGGSTSTSLPVNVTVNGVQKTSTPPTIDGTKEALWNSYGATTLTKGTAGITSSTDLSATYRMTYDANFLYLLIDVTD
ncbi:MAG TPA: Ig-like domain-containing protein, partial [Cytophagaceae bacterium]|nr:Ig-like domain-containing protein [Cytophagaceae bacterium]